MSTLVSETPDASEMNQPTIASLRAPSSSPSRRLGWRKHIVWSLTAWMVWTVAMSIPAFRAICIYPLYVHHEDARGEVAYVMADGHAIWERLRIASDLFHQGRIAQIMILDERQPAGFNFARGRMDSRAQRSIDFLASYGVPSDCISAIPINESTRMGSLSEARGLRKHEPDLKRLVVVTSAPHTRRSLLSFRRTWPANVSVQVYSASRPQDSAELNSPIWLEYLKLAVYYAS